MPHLAIVTGGWIVCAGGVGNNGERMITLIDYLSDGIRRIFDNWQPSPPEPSVQSRPWGMGYCWHCGHKSFTVYLVWVDIGPNLGERMRPMWLHGHDQCTDVLAQAYQQEIAKAHEYDCYIYDPAVWGK